MNSGKSGAPGQGNDRRMWTEVDRHAWKSARVRAACGEEVQVENGSGECMHGHAI
jgi:hypothetical protein